MIVNGKEYKLPEFTFKTICDLEDYGVSPTNFTQKPLKTILAFVALAVGGDADKAAKEIEAHMIGGNSLDPIFKEISDSMEKSGFFRALSQRKEAETQAGEGETAVGNEKE